MIKWNVKKGAIQLIAKPSQEGLHPRCESQEITNLYSSKGARPVVENK